MGPEDHAAIVRAVIVRVANAPAEIAVSVEIAATAVASTAAAWRDRPRSNSKS
jgi:hypothetical protein